MGTLVNAPPTTWIAGAAAAMVALLGCSLPILLLF
jgi:manganese transport protein